MDVFSETRQRVSAEDAARRYGLEFDRKGWALCPFHGDKHPSMSFKNGRFRCWACNASGTSIDFTAQYLGLDPLGAVRQLNNDFALGLSLDKPATRKDLEDARKRKENAELHARFEDWRRSTANHLNSCYRIAHRALPPFTEGEMLALRYREALEDWADTLMSGTAEDQMALYRQRGRLKSLTEQILTNTPMR